VCVGARICVLGAGASFHVNADIIIDLVSVPS
jgi:hypothetical protein